MGRSPLYQTARLWLCLRLFWGNFLVIEARGGTWFRTRCPNVARSRPKCQRRRPDPAKRIGSGLRSFSVRLRCFYGFSDSTPCSGESPFAAHSPSRRFPSCSDSKSSYWTGWDRHQTEARLTCRWLNRSRACDAQSWAPQRRRPLRSMSKHGAMVGTSGEGVGVSHAV